MSKPYGPFVVDNEKDKLTDVLRYLLAAKSVHEYDGHPAGTPVFMPSMLNKTLFKRQLELLAVSAIFA